jgi:uncharacterized membrane protein YbhN (UPF0104 family)
VSRTAPIVVAERLTDLLGFLVLVALGGLTTAPEYAWVFWATLGLAGGVLAVAGSRRLGELACDGLARLPVVGRAAPRLRTASGSARVLLAARELAGPVVLATAGWTLECVGFWLVASALVEGGLGFAFCTYTYALAAVAGAVVIFTPGGLGVTEGAMTGLLAARYEAAGVVIASARARAVSATLVIRLCTLWFAMGVGMVAWWLFRKGEERA